MRRDKRRSWYLDLSGSCKVRTRRGNPRQESPVKQIWWTCLLKLILGSMTTFSSNIQWIAKVYTPLLKCQMLVENNRAWIRFSWPTFQSGDVLSAGIKGCFRDWFDRAAEIHISSLFAKSSLIFFFFSWKLRLKKICVHPVVNFSFRQWPPPRTSVAPRATYCRQTEQKEPKDWPLRDTACRGQAIRFKISTPLLLTTQVVNKQ